MLFLYNLLWVAAIILAGPFLLVKVILTPKYRRRIPGRLGIGLDRLAGELAGRRPRLWIHALSVGEVGSAAALVRGLRQALPEACIIFSATTRSGGELAARTLGGEVDLLVPFPLDLAPSVQRFVSTLDPDCFVLVETDFWPNFLWQLKRRGVPAVLVNGRISDRSFRRYHRLRALARPLFDSFTVLSMQTEADARNMARLGVAAAKIRPLGNLKYEALTAAAPSEAAGVDRAAYAIPAGGPLLVAGSTHAGEEAMVFEAAAGLAACCPDLFVVIAPRHVERGREIAELARRFGLTASQRSEGRCCPAGTRVLVLDTIGELAAVYRFADVALVGGSLVAAGGHNPLEPAGWGRPVLFGPHMEDFAEVSRDLVAAGGAIQLAGEGELGGALAALLADPGRRQRMGERAARLVAGHRGVTARHVALIKDLIHGGDRR